MANKNIILHPIVNGVQDNATNLYPKTLKDNIVDYVVDTTLSAESENPVQNKVITAALGGIVAPSIGYGMVTLAPPVVTGGVNSIAWEDNPLNADKSSVVTADVDGVTVTSPLTITQAMDGSTLTITASADGYADGVTTIVLAYMDVATKSLFAIPAPTGSVPSGKTLYVSFGTNAYGRFKGKVGDQTYTFDETNNCVSIPVTADSTAQYEISFVAQDSPNGNAYFVFTYLANAPVNPSSLNFDAGCFVTGSVSLLKNGEVVSENTVSNFHGFYTYFPSGGNYGDIYTAIINITSLTVV